MTQNTPSNIFGRNQVDQAFKRFGDSPDGQIVLRFLCKKYEVFKPAPYAGDPHQQAFNDGAKAAILSILHKSKWDYQKLLETAERQANETHYLT